MKEEFFLTEEPQLVNVSRMEELERHHFATHNEIMDLGRSSKLLQTLHDIYSRGLFSGSSEPLINFNM